MHYIDTLKNVHIVKGDFRNYFSELQIQLSEQNNMLHLQCLHIEN